MRRSLGFSLLAGVAATLAGAPAADAARINVHPGPGAIQDAIDSASPGDTLRIHRGTYRGAVTVDKRLTLKDAGDGRPTITGRCAHPTTVDVQHRGVALRGLRVVGGESFEINFTGVPSGSVRNVFVRNTCGSAEYGINVFASGHLDLAHNRATKLTDAGIYVGGIQQTGRGTLRVRRNNLFGNNRGIIVEDSLRKADILVRNNRTHDNTIGGEGRPSGIFLHNSDGVVLRGNHARHNGDYGIHLDPGSDHNRLFGNVARHNGARNFRDQGTANCGSGNSFPIPHC